MFSEKVIKNEISSLSSIIDKSKKDERGIFEYGMALVIQAMNAEDICFILSNLIDMEQNEEIKKLKLMQKEAVLSICHDENTALLLHTMLSFLNDKELEEVSKSLSDFAFVLKFNKLLALSTESSFHNDEDTLKMKLQYTDAADASTGSCEVINFFNKPRELVSETEKDLLNDFVKDEHPRTAAFILAWLSSGYFSAGGIDSVTDILLHTDRSIRKQIFKQWEKDDPELAEEVKDRMFSFSDIASMNDRDIQKVMREVDSQELAKALKKTDESVKEKIYYNMSKRAAAMIREDMEYMGPVRICNIEEAQRKIVSIIRHLDDAGEINKG
ncbi:MAG: hypothetical protein FWB83_01995 [Treponema sp.]|nr:hypothetical protein [Treponema sp.]